MSKHRDKERDKAETRRLILDPNRPPYTGGVNWLGHGGRDGKQAEVDYLLLDGATMERLLSLRGAIDSHFRSLKEDHDLLVTKDADEKYRFDRTHLGIPFAPADDGHSAGELVATAIEVTEDGYFSPATLRDERKRTLREIVQRRGQPKFREELIGLYGGKCVITGCDAVAALEAAHIVPYCGPESNDVTNGLLLRSDIHTLFDLYLVGVHADSFTVELAPVLMQTSYRNLQGKQLNLHAAPTRPNKEALIHRWNQFRSNSGYDY